MTDDESADDAMLVPRKRASDLLREYFVGAPGAIPFLGDAVSAWVNQVLPSPYERRVRRLLGRILQKLDDEEIRLDRFRGEVFAALAIAIEASVSSDDAKLDYLANAVVNVVDDE